LIPLKWTDFRTNFTYYFAFSLIDCIIDFQKNLVMADKDRVFIFDTTMRDGEQSPGASMSLEEKIQIARVFDELGIDIIEAGFPIASPGDFEAVSEVSKILKNSIPAGLSRHSVKDIDRAYEALKHAPRFRIHTFISTSPLHMKHKLNMSPEDVYESIGKHVTYARKFTDDVEWSCEDGTRTDMDYMCKTVELAIKSGATTINIPDTVGYTIPSEFITIIETLLNKVPNIDKAILSTHCHNDLGLAVANSLAGVQAGARQIECTINGLGERAGNAALEEVVMAIKTRPDLLPYDTGINTTLLSKASKIVSNATGFPVQYNKAIVGKNAFAHEAGIHQDGMLKNRQTYEIMTPESVGVKQTSLVMGKHSGRHAFKDKMNSLGYPDLTDDVVSNAFAKFKVLADKKKHVYDEDIIALVDDSLIIDNKVNAISLKSLKVFAGTGEPQRAEMTLDVYGDVKQASETGDGPVDAIFKCIKALYPHDVNLQLYQVHAVTEGTDAQATVSVKIEEKGKTTVGQAADTDTLVASANAYINALNKMIIKRDKTAPMEQENQKVRGI
jgi:2-isopropylmalate synthase